MFYREGGREYALPRIPDEQAAEQPATPTATAAPVLEETGAAPDYAGRLGPALVMFAFGAWLVWRGLRGRTILSSK
jgi:hypothetical protein